jgi:hypothetical protein
MARYFPLAGLLLVMGSVVGAPASAVAQGPPVPTSGRSLARLDRAAGVIEGRLTRVDGGRETVEISIGVLGLLGKILEVNEDTRIRVDGHDARFADLQEGARVKAFFEERGAKLVATRLEVSTGG